MEKNILRVILLILLIGTFNLIFDFSGQTGEESSGISRKITNLLVNNIKYIQEKPENVKEEIVERIEKVVRKIAHFSIYTVVGILLMSFVSTYPLKDFTRSIISLGAGIIYATSDEIHQSFIPRKKSNGNRCDDWYNGSAIRHFSGNFRNENLEQY